jgi:N-methylhydantoinase A
MRIGFDTGGTFTDVVFTNSEGRVSAIKLLSLHEILGDTIKAAVRERAQGERDFVYVHGTTIGSNAVIEGKTAPFGLITSRGFRDIIELRSERRPAVYDVNWDRLRPLTRRAMRMEIVERLLADGTVQHPVDRAEVEQTVRTLLGKHAQAIAICLFNSYLDHTHEREVLEIVKALAPELAVCTSESFSEVGEYERASTVCVNASLMPIMERYLSRLEQQLDIDRGGLQIMQSNGGLMGSLVARLEPVRMLESGPAAGVLAVARIAADIGLKDALSFDMGGTTAKAAMIKNGQPAEKANSEVGGGATLATRLFGGGGHVVRVPTYDIVEVGAGGGSLARVDASGVLHVGPEGAGADPGPVCYGRGGVQPTVTDANVVLGYMNPIAIADGTVPIDRDAAYRAIEQQIARPLGLQTLDAALGILRVADSTMIRALRAVTIERGVDPRNLTLVGFGGSGPIHAARLAQNMSISRVYIPPYSGVLSALGLLLADYRHDAVHTFMKNFSDVSEPELHGAFERLESEALSYLSEEERAAHVTVAREVNLQYRNETSPLAIAVDGATPEGQLHSRLTEAFQLQHRAEFGYERDEPPLLISARVRVTVPSSAIPISQLALRQAGSATKHPDRREIYFGPTVGTVNAPIMTRAHLTGAGKQGPLIVEEPDTSVLIPPGWHARCDDHMGLLLEFGPATGSDA